jgi:hypothetical protein
VRRASRSNSAPVVVSPDLTHVNPFSRIPDARSRVVISGNDACRATFNRYRALYFASSLSSDLRGTRAPFCWTWMVFRRRALRFGSISAIAVGLEKKWGAEIIVA